MNSFSLNFAGNQRPPKDIDDYIAYCIEQRRRFQNDIVPVQPEMRGGSFDEPRGTGGTCTV